MGMKLSPELERRCLEMAGLLPPLTAEPPPSRKPSKMKNVPVDSPDGFFASGKEYARWGELKLLATTGMITELDRQVTFSLDHNGVHICNYIADFVYIENGAWIVEDVKGMRTTLYKIKRALMLALLGIEIRET